MESILEHLRYAWRVLPLSLRQRLYPKLFKLGALPYTLSYMADFYERHGYINFAGNLLNLKETYWQSPSPSQEVLSRRFVEIVDNLVLPNGVRKTTHFERQNAVLSTIFGAGMLKFEREAISILDVPSSIGIASLDTYDFLSRHYKVASYVLGDLCFEVLYDKDRECIYDGSGNLLQVGRNGRFISVYSPHSKGHYYRNVFVSCLLAPLSIRGWLVKRSFPFRRGSHNVPILILHPEVEDRVKRGIFQLQQVDVFSKIEGRFDLILSFNLLQKNYFSQDRINLGIENLKNALSEDGLLIIGNDHLFCVWKKIGEALVVVDRNGDF